MTIADEQGSVPTAWHFVPCDSAVRHGGGGPYTLTRVRLEIPNPLGRVGPRPYPELCFYLALTGGTGVHTFQIQQVCLRDQTRSLRGPTFTMDMGDDRTAVHERAERWISLLFWEVGQCEFLLYCDGVLLSHAVIDVRE